MTILKIYLSIFLDVKYEYLQLNNHIVYLLKHINTNKHISYNILTTYYIIIMVYFIIFFVVNVKE